MDAVILAGGRGERLSKITKNLPKPLINVGKKSVLVHQIELLKRFQFKKIYILSGYLGNQILEHTGDGKRWGLKLVHIIEQKPLGTAGALGQLRKSIKSDFLVFSGDLVLDIDLKRFVKFHKNHIGSTSTILVHPSSHPADSDLVLTDNDRIRKIFFKPHSNKVSFDNLSIASVYIFSSNIFKYIDINRRSDLEKDVLKKALKKGANLTAYKSAEYVKDMGTLKRLIEVRRDFKNGKVKRMRLSVRRPAVFLDRDGVLIEDPLVGNKLKEVRVLGGTAKAIKRINDRGLLTIVISNQAAIAKGFIKIDDVKNIHRNLSLQISAEGAIIDEFYFCPHHPKKGFAGEVKKYKIVCNCRKPKTGMIRRAAKQFNIDLKSSFLIGDGTVDVKTAQNAGVKFVGVKTGYGLKDNKYKISSRVVVKNDLLEAVNYILSS